MIGDLKMYKLNLKYLFPLTDNDLIFDDLKVKIKEIDSRVEKLENWISFMDGNEFKKIQLQGMEESFIQSWKLFHKVVEEFDDTEKLREQLNFYCTTLAEIENNIKNQL